MYICIYYIITIIIYYIITIIIYYIIYYILYILYYTLLSSPIFFPILSFLFLPISSSSSQYSSPLLPILSSSVLFFLPILPLIFLPLSSSLLFPIHSIRVGTWIHLFMSFFHSSLSPIFSPFLPSNLPFFLSLPIFLYNPLPHSLQFLPLPSQSSSHSKYTCRYLRNLIYIQSVSDNLTPHVLSEWMVEVCGAYLYRVVF